MEPCSAVRTAGSVCAVAVVAPATAGAVRAGEPARADEIMDRAVGTAAGTTKAPAGFPVGACVQPGEAGRRIRDSNS